MSRAWKVNDAVCENRGGWRIGVVASVDPSQVAVRWDCAELVSFRSPGAEGLVAPEQVPIDERHWLPEKVRDQLVRQEAAGRLRACADAMTPGHPGRFYLLAIADDMEDLLQSDSAPAAESARALLAPAPAPATTP